MPVRAVTLSQAQARVARARGATVRPWFRKSESAGVGAGSFAQSYPDKMSIAEAEELASQAELTPAEHEAMLQVAKRHPDLSTSEATLLVRTFREFLQTAEECKEEEGQEATVASGDEVERTCNFDSLSLAAADLCAFSDACTFLPPLDYELLTLNAAEHVLAVRAAYARPTLAGLALGHRAAAHTGDADVGGFSGRGTGVQVLRDDSPLAFDIVVDILLQARVGNRAIGAHPRFPFDPESTKKQTWDGIIMLLLLYTTFSVPYALAFGASTTLQEKVVNLMCACVRVCVCVRVCGLSC